MDIRWGLLGILLLGLLCPGLAIAQAQCAMPTASYWDASGRDTLTVSGTAQPLTLAKIPNQDNPSMAMAFITVESGTISYDFTTTPTATLGHQAAAGSQITLCGAVLMQTFRAINTAGAATLKITYLRGH